MTPARVLFVCIENSNRSQMAEAFARIEGEGVLDPFSAGSKPSGVVNPRAVAAMSELGYDLTAHRSLGLDQIPDGDWEWVITMGCGDVCPWVPAANTDDWALPDPRAMPPEEFNTVRDEIRRRVRGLVERVRAAGSGTDAAS